MATPTDITPTTDDVHALLARRPAFTDTSKPSKDDVQALIGQMAAAVWSELDEDLPPRLYGKARHAVTLGVASLVEDTYFPEQQLGDSVGAVLYQRYKDEIVGLRKTAGASKGDRVKHAGTANVTPVLGIEAGRRCRRI